MNSRFQQMLTLDNPLNSLESAQVPLLAAVSSGHFSVAQQLLQSGGSAASVQSLKEHDSDGRTALHLAALHGNVDMVHMLLESAATAGAELAATSARDAAGWTVWHFAAAHNHLQVMLELLKSEKGRGSMCLTDNSGQTALCEAALRGHYEVAEQLLAVPEGWPAIDIVDNDSPGMSVFYTAAMHGNYAVSALVLQRSMLLSAANSTPASSALTSIPDPCSKSKLLRLLGKCGRPTLLGLLNWQAGSCAAVRLHEPPSLQTGPSVNLAAQFMALGQFRDGSVKPGDLGQPALDLLQQQVQVSVGLTLDEKDVEGDLPANQGDTLQMLLRTGITVKVLNIANGEHGFGHFPYEVEVNMEPCCSMDRSGNTISTPAVSSGAAPFDRTMMNTVAMGASLQAGRNPNITVRRDTASTRATKASHSHWEEHPHDAGRRWKLTAFRSEPIMEVHMEDFLRSKAKRSCLPSFMRKSGVPMIVPGFQLYDDKSGLPSLRMDFLSSDYPGSFDWQLPMEIPSASMDWKVTVAVRTAFLGAGKLQGFWETREFKAETIVQPAAGEGEDGAARPGRRCPNSKSKVRGAEPVQQIPPMMPGAPGMGPI